MRYFGINPDGRDFITGDVHGAFGLLDDALDLVDFDPETDRLFCTGDLINRGPDPARALEFLQRPYVESILGNHEIMMLRTFCADTDIPGALQRIGMDWILAQTTQEDRHALMQLFSDMPAAMEIETPRGNVGIVHGEVPAGINWDQFVHFLGIENNDADCPIVRSSQRSASWGRARFNAGDRTGVEGIGRVFCGHTTITSGPVRLGNCFYIDTGSYKAALGDPGHLTLTDITASSEAIAPIMDGHERFIKGGLNIILRRPNDPDTPFADLISRDPGMEQVMG